MIFSFSIVYDSEVCLKRIQPTVAPVLWSITVQDHLVFFRRSFKSIISKGLMGTKIEDKNRIRPLECYYFFCGIGARYESLLNRWINRLSSPLTKHLIMLWYASKLTLFSEAVKERDTKVYQCGLTTVTLL